MRSFIFILSALAAFCGQASAATIRGEQAGSTYFLFVSNPEAREVRCLGRVFASYLADNTAGSVNRDIIGTVPEKAKNFMFAKWTTPWPGEKLGFIHEVQCR